MAERWFSDVEGVTVELVSLDQMPKAEFAARWPDVKGKWADSFSKWVGLPAGGKRRQDELPLTRRINYKSHPSKHKCDSRCMYAKGRTMTCECSCGGKNHGKGG